MRRLEKAWEGVRRRASVCGAHLAHDSQDVVRAVRVRLDRREGAIREEAEDQAKDQLAWRSRADEHRHTDEGDLARALEDLEPIGADLIPSGELAQCHGQRRAHLLELLRIGLIHRSRRLGDAPAGVRVLASRGRLEKRHLVRVLGGDLKVAQRSELVARAIEDDSVECGDADREEKQHHNRIGVEGGVTGWRGRGVSRAYVMGES